MKKKYFQIIIALFVFTQVTKAQNKPNIVWIVSEDNSKHYMKLFDENGVTTPNIEKLAAHGITYTHAFSNAAVCSAARSTLIASSYGPRLATHYHRKIEKVEMPTGVEMFPAYLRKNGYYTTNCAKEDYNIVKKENVWDESSKKATWKKRKDGQPFFHVFNIGTTHESRMHFSEEDILKGTENNQETAFIQPNHPQSALFKYSVARYQDKIQQMDSEVGAVIAELEKDDLLNDTFIFYYGDHGGVLPGSKGYINEMGVHVPLVVYIPENYKNLAFTKPGNKQDAFVSFVDFGATVLNIAGVDIPKGIDGKPFLGKNISAKNLASRDETFSYADRFDEKYDMVRAVRKGNFKYTRNYQPFNFDGLMNNYRYRQLGYQQWRTYFESDKLNDVQSKFFEKKSAEELYDIEKDPYETNNLANLPEYQKTVKELRKNLNTRICSMPDLSFYPEFYLLKNAFNNPVAFGQEHKKDIKKYLKVADYMLADFDKIEKKLIKSLDSNDPWERYWAIITCSSFGTKAISLTKKLEKIEANDPELINSVRAAEYLGIIGKKNPANSMTTALYNSKDSTEALLILNSIVLMRDGYNYKFNIDRSRINPNVLQEKLISDVRLAYLNVK
ncbi:sulfatase family protein [Flavicella marina]|uniref:sulfatase family protein n=1 Tax=Flavicella marina TaxID=1475951 RepID=UPI001265196F|nr:sulfatase [Flavicella marina]